MFRRFIPLALIVFGLFSLPSTHPELMAAKKGKNWAVYTIDQSHSVVGFTVRHLLTKTRGVFNEFDGKFKFDAKRQAIRVKSFEIKAASIDTRQKKRDEHLRSPDFFDAKKYPAIKFVSKDVARVKKGKKVKVTGKLTMHGVTKPMVLDVEYLGSVKNPYAPTMVASFSVSGKLKRSEFGMKWNDIVEGVNLVSDEVTIDIQLELHEKTLDKKSDKKKS